MYGQKEKDRSCYGGKQMQTNPAKDGRLPDTYFDKKYTWISDVCINCISTSGNRVYSLNNV